MFEGKVVLSLRWTRHSIKEPPLTSASFFFFVILWASSAFRVRFDAGLGICMIAAWILAIISFCRLLLKRCWISHTHQFSDSVHQNTAQCYTLMYTHTHTLSHGNFHNSSINRWARCHHCTMLQSPVLESPSYANQMCVFSFWVLILKGM